MKINEMSIVEFNENISKNISAAKEGEVIYLTWRKTPVAVLIGKKDFDIIMGELADALEGEYES